MSVSLSDLVSQSPAVVRKLIRDGKLKGRPTTRYCQGYKQANLTILPGEFAHDFLTFTKSNSGALPFLYSSEPDEFSAVELCKDSDVRTDVPLYLKLVNGRVAEILQNLNDDEVRGFVSFYLGCSFSFNRILIANGILKNVEIDRNVSMYRTNVPNVPSGPFSGNLVVSMRYIHKHQLSMVTSLTFPLDDVHGAPIHYGNPKRIGIDDIDTPDYGDVTHKEDGDVAVFWCCGVTGVEAVKSANLAVAFTHHPGCMFITDVEQQQPITTAPQCHVVQYKRDMYGVVSGSKLAILSKLAAIASQDIGNRGMSALIVDGDFVKACLALSYANSVALTTGFPVNAGPFDETDGLPGVITLTSLLTALGKQVTLICDDHNYDLYTEILTRCYDRHLIPSPINIECGSTISLISADQTPPRFDAMLATERAGRSSDGRYYSMKCRDVTERVTSRIDDVFTDAMMSGDVVTIGIGDGGNELGMGKVRDRVVKEIDSGAKIASTTETDLLLACGVSNWGCEALSFGIAELMTCPYHERHQRRAVGFPFNVQQIHKWKPTVERSRAILSVVESFGIADGISPTNSMSVDGMFFECEHKTILQQMQNSCSS